MRRNGCNKECVKFMYFKVHNEQVLACCDKALAGKKIKADNLEVEADIGFYGNEEITEERLAEMLKECQNANLLGKKAVDVALKAKVISEKSVIKLGKVPHAVILKI